MSNSQLIEQLKHNDPQKRIDAIRKLVELDNFSAMDALKDVYYNDEHPDVREEARLAGLELRGRHNPTGFEGVPRPDSMPAPANPPVPIRTVNGERQSVWSTVKWAELAPYLVGFTLLGIIGFNVNFTLFVNSVISAIPEIEATIANNSDTATFGGGFDWSSLEGSSVSAIASLFTGIVMTVIFLFECYVINHMATNSYRGRSDFTVFMRDFTQANIIVGLIFWVLLIPITSQGGQLVISLYQDPATSSTSVNALASLASCGFPLAIIGFAVYQSRVIAKSYQISVGNGFVCLLVGYLSAQFAGLFLQIFVPSPL